MPEGDTVYLTARRLREALAGRVLIRSDFRVPRWATVDLTGRPVDSVVPRGKHLLIGVGDITIHSHLRLEGSWRIDRSGTRPQGPAHQIRIILANEQWQAYGLRVPVIDVVRTGEEGQFVDHLGPDILGPDWDSERALANLTADPKRPIGEALLDQRNLAGIGNMYMAETCFINRTHPAAPVGSISRPDELIATSFRLLQANKDRASQSTLFMAPALERRTDANSGVARGEGAQSGTAQRGMAQRGMAQRGMAQSGIEHWVYGRSGRACLICSSPIRSAVAGSAGPDDSGELQASAKRHASGELQASAERHASGERQLVGRRMYWCPTCQLVP